MMTSGDQVSMEILSTELNKMQVLRYMARKHEEILVLLLF